MDNRYGRPNGTRMGQSRPEPQQKAAMRQDTNINCDSRKTARTGMNMRSAGTDAKYIQRNPGQRRADDFFRTADKSPYLAHDMDDERQMKRMEDINRFRFDGNGRTEMRGKCLDMNRRPQKGESIMGTMGGPQKSVQSPGGVNRNFQKSDSNMRTMGASVKSAAGGAYRSTKKNEEYLGWNNRRPQKSEEVLGAGRMPQKNERTGMNEARWQGTGNAGTKNFCDYQSRRTTGRDDRKR